VFIPYSRQNINAVDIEKVCEVLRSEFLTQGPVVPTFEKAVAEKFNAQYAVAVNSATSVLHIACLVLGVGPGDTVWTSPNTFVATANCARYCGASVDFVDIDSRTWCMSVEKLRKKLEHHQDANLSLPKVVIPVHLSGQSCDMRGISELSKKYGFHIIEDASHAIGGMYKDVPVGSCDYSDITVFSFHPVKIITTGEGGMALTNDKKLTDHMARLRTHGITRDSKQLTHEPDGPWYYEQLELGFNFRITEIQAALGLSQLGRLEEFVVRRNELAKRYDEALADMTVQFQKVPDDVYSARHLYVIRVPSEQHFNIFKSFRDKGIGVNLHYMPVHLQPYYRDLGFQEGDFPEAEKHGQEAISLPLFPNLTDSEQDHVIVTLRSLI
jgi:UDP-4-amino-4,6-dideoxy-N-acetyl-beta-L-altrosamine transaminase